MWKHYVYIHCKADTGEPFYVGKGKLRRSGRCYERAHAFERRNSFWRRVANKHGVQVQIIASCADDVAAQEVEKAYIAGFGRRNIGTGILVNLTDGGDGHAGIVVSDDLRNIRSRNARGPRSVQWVTAIRESRKNGGNGGVVKKGDKLPDWWKQRISKAVQGENNAMYGRTGAKHPNAKAVIDAETGQTFPTVTAAAKHIGMRMQTLHNMLTGFRPNSTSMRFA